MLRADPTLIFPTDSPGSLSCFPLGEESCGGTLRSLLLLLRSANTSLDTSLRGRSALFPKGRTLVSSFSPLAKSLPFKPLLNGSVSLYFPLWTVCEV